MQKISTLNDNCPQKDSSENDSYVGVQTFIGITENHLVEVQFTKDDLLERILSPDNLNRAYKQVMSNGGSGGVDKMETEFLLPYLKLHKDELINTLLDGNYRPNLIKQYFDLQMFDFKAYKQLIKEYNTSTIVQEPMVNTYALETLPSLDKEEQLAKVRAEILKYESGEKQPKHIGQRMFGYLLKANYINAYNDEQRLEAWKEFTGLEQQPEKSYLRDPDYNKNETIKINQQLKQIEEFFYLIGLDIPITYHEKEKKKY